MTKPLLVLGAGGHASVLIDILKQQQREIVGIVCPGNKPDKNLFSDIPHYSNDTDVLNFGKKNINLINGIGSLPGASLRNSIYNHFLSLGFNFETVIADSSIVSTYSHIGNGVQLMHGTIIQSGASLGNGTIINTGSIIDHDCSIGAYNHIAPGATLSGQVKTGENVHIGTGASVIQSVVIGKNVVIGAGAVITKDVEDNSVFYPAKGITKLISRVSV